MEWKTPHKKKKKNIFINIELKVDINALIVCNAHKQKPNLFSFTDGKFLMSK